MNETILLNNACGLNIRPNGSNDPFTKTNRSIPGSQNTNKMRIKKINYQFRRDFQAIFECDHCGHETECGGYDDAYFHKNVIPEMKCGECGKKAGDDYRPLTTKYPEGFKI